MPSLLRAFRALPPVFASRYLLSQVARRLLLPEARTDFSVGGESSFVEVYFNYRESGFYVDVGCNHPVAASNTFKLYLKGWSGIAIDGDETMIAQYRKVRKLDRAVHALVSDEDRLISFYRFEGRPDVNTVSKEYADDFAVNMAPIKDIIELRGRSLTSILDECLGGVAMPIDLLSVDVEGHDLNVLRSLDTEKYRPQLIIAEAHALDALHPGRNAMVAYLAGKEFQLIAFKGGNAYFEDARNPRWPRPQAAE